MTDTLFVHIPIAAIGANIPIGTQKNTQNTAAAIGIDIERPSDAASMMGGPHPQATNDVIKHRNASLETSSISPVKSKCSCV